MMTKDGAPPLVVAYGMGVDSTAMLVGMRRRGERPDLILFADTGGEKPRTYDYLGIIQSWLASVGFLPVVVVRRPRCDGEHGSYDTLEGNCLVNETLPSLAFGGRKGCSAKWKIDPQNAYCRTWQPAVVAWARGQKVTKLIGYDAGPKDSKRCVDHAEDDRYTYRYPLREWGWDRQRCEAEIFTEGLSVPPKSACFFCPATQPGELAELERDHPDLCDRIVAMETAARPHLVQISGLWGRGTKGFRGAVPKPGSMTEFILATRASGAWRAPPPVRAKADRAAAAAARALRLGASGAEPAIPID